MRRLEFFDGLFSVCTEDAVLVDAQRPLKRGIIQPLRITAGRLYQISGAEDFSRPVRRIRCRTGHVGDSCIMIHRHIARFNVVDTDFPVQVTSGAVSRASLNADQVTRLQLLTCGHIDLRQKRKRGFKTKREAQEWEREFHLQKAKSCDMTLASFVELYFNDREHHVRDTTMDTKRNVFDTKIVPLLGNRKMNEITALDIRDWQQRVKEMGEATGLPYSETYLYTIHAQLTALFNYAQTFYGLRFNPCDAAGYMGSSVAGEMLIITKDQYELLRKEFRNEAYLLAFDILFWTGCREGEMLALLPKDLTDDDQLRIYKTYHRKKGQDIFGPTKNSKKGGNRNVPIPHWLAEEFRTYCSRLYGLTPDDRVFYMTCTALNKELTRCTQLTYLPDIRVHDLRHSHVSLCIELGYSVVLVARRIGDTVPVVMRTYAHLYPNKQQELVSKLEAIGSPSSNDDESDLMSLG